MPSIRRGSARAVAASAKQVQKEVFMLNEKDGRCGQERECVVASRVGSDLS